MKRLVIAYLAAAAFSVLAARPAQAAAYSAVKGFYTKANPNGPWSYLYDGAALSSVEVIDGNLKVAGWTNGENSPSYAAVIRNSTGSTFQYGTEVLSTDHLNMDPQSNYSVAVRFTAPIAGSYVFTGDFLGQDIQEAAHPIYIRVNGGPAIFTGTISSNGQTLTFKETLSLHANDTVDFQCGTAQNTWTNLSTGLKLLVAAH